MRRAPCRVALLLLVSVLCLQASVAAPVAGKGNSTDAEMANNSIDANNSTDPEMANSSTGAEVADNSTDLEIAKKDNSTDAEVADDPDPKPAKKPTTMHAGPMHSELQMLSHKFGQLKQAQAEKHKAVEAASLKRVQAAHAFITAKQEAKQAEQEMQEKMHTLQVMVHQKMEQVSKAKLAEETAEKTLQVAHSDEKAATARVEQAMGVVKKAADEVDRPARAPSGAIDAAAEAAAKALKDKAMLDGAHESNFKEVVQSMNNNKGEVQPIQQAPTPYNSAHYDTFEGAFNAALEHPSLAGTPSVAKGSQTELDSAQSLNQTATANNAKLSGYDEFQRALAHATKNLSPVPKAAKDPQQADKTTNEGILKKKTSQKENVQTEKAASKAEIKDNNDQATSGNN